MSQAAYAGVDTDGDHSARRVGLNLSGTARRQVLTSRVITFNVFIYSRYFCCLPLVVYTRYHVDFPAKRNVRVSLQ